MKTKTLLIGDTNPLSRDPRLALWHDPPNGAGGRLVKILGLSINTYHRSFERVNVNDLESPEEYATVLHRAQEAQADTSCGAKGCDTPVIVLGSRACATLHLPFYSFWRKGRLLVLPHPSGRCRIWNELASVSMARRCVSELTGLQLPPVEPAR